MTANSSIRMRVTITYEYDANLDHYPEGATPQMIAEIDNNMDFAQIVAEEGEMTIVPVAADDTAR